MNTMQKILGALEPVGDVATVPRGTVIVHSGERARQVAVLLEGTVEEVIGGAVVIIDSPGSLLAAERLFDDRPALGTLRAVTGCSLLLVAPEQLRKILDVGIAEWVLSHLDARVAAARAALLSACPQAVGAA